MEQVTIEQVASRGIEQSDLLARCDSPRDFLTVTMPGLPQFRSQDESMLRQVRALGWDLSGVYGGIAYFSRPHLAPVPERFS